MLTECLLGLLVAVALTVAAFFRKRRAMCAPDPAYAAPLPPSLDPSGVEAFLAGRDEAAAPLRPGCAASVRWAPGRERQRARACVVFIHGWSASPEEIDPVDADVAAALGATLLRVRLTGHGLAPTARCGEAMRDQSRPDALRMDAATGFALGALLGERVLLVGCSTGGSLAMWIAAQPWSRPALAGLVLISPAWTIARFGSRLYNLLKWPLVLAPRPLGSRLLRMVTGPTMRHPPPITEELSRVWTTEYPAPSVLNVMEVFVSVEVSVSPPRLALPVLAFANPSDRAVDFRSTAAHVHSMPNGTLEVVTDSENHHVLTGRIKSPSTVPRVTARVEAFARSVLGAER